MQGIVKPGGVCIFYEQRLVSGASRVKYRIVGFNWETASVYVSIRVTGISGICSVSGCCLSFRKLGFIWRRLQGQVSIFIVCLARHWIPVHASVTEAFCRIAEIFHVKVDPGF